MNNISLRRSFALFHMTLAIVVVLQSVRTLMEALTHHPDNPSGSHLAILAGVEALAALLFILPRTIKVGGVLLLLVLCLAMLVHGLQHELNLIVYAAGVLFVTIHGSAFSTDLFRIRKIAS